MSNENPFLRMKSYCESNRKSDVIRNIAFGIYEQQLLELVEDKTGENGQPPTEDELETMKDTLLSENSMTSHVRLAEDMFAEQSKTHMEPSLRRYKNVSFWKGVGASVLANVIYSILLIVLFMVAEERIAGWLTSLSQ